jgi:hypothetical protein
MCAEAARCEGRARRDAPELLEALCAIRLRACERAAALGTFNVKSPRGQANAKV